MIIEDEKGDGDTSIERNGTYTAESSQAPILKICFIIIILK